VGHPGAIHTVEESHAGLGKNVGRTRHTIGVARAALAGKGQHDLLSEAVQTLLATGEAESVWCLG